MNCECCKNMCTDKCQTCLQTTPTGWYRQFYDPKFPPETGTPCPAVFPELPGKPDYDEAT